MNMEIKLSLVTDIANFVKLTNSVPYEQELRQGRFVVDAKSILGIMSLDLSKPIQYWCDTHDVELLVKIRHYKLAI